METSVTALNRHTSYWTIGITKLDEQYSMSIRQNGLSTTQIVVLQSSTNNTSHKLYYLIFVNENEKWNNKAALHAKELEVNTKQKQYS